MTWLGLFDPPGIRADMGTLPNTGNLLFCRDCEVWWDRWEEGPACWFCGKAFQLVA